MAMSHRNSNLAYLGAITVGLVIAYPFAMSLLSNKNEFGFLVLLGAPIICSILLGLVRKWSRSELPSDSPNESKPVESNRAALAAFAFLAALVLGLIAGLIFAWQAHPLDKEGIFIQLTFLGLTAGVIVSLALLVSSDFK